MRHALKVGAPLVALGLGAAIWWLSPAMTGRREPWDAPGPYFLLALLLAGSIAGMLLPGRPWKAGGLIYLGQLIAMLLGSGGDLGLWPLGAVLLMVSTLFSVVTAGAAGWMVHRAGIMRRKAGK